MVYLKFSAPPTKSVPAPHRKFVIRNLLKVIIRHSLKLLFDQSIKFFYQFIEIDYSIYGRFVHWATRVTAGHGGWMRARRRVDVYRASAAPVCTSTSVTDGAEKPASVPTRTPPAVSASTPPWVDAMTSNEPLPLTMLRVPEPSEKSAPVTTMTGRGSGAQTSAHAGYIVRMAGHAS